MHRDEDVKQNILCVFGLCLSSRAMPLSPDDLRALLKRPDLSDVQAEEASGY